MEWQERTGLLDFEETKVSLHQPEPTSLARAQLFNRSQIQKFYSLLASLTEKHNINQREIYNMDESAITTVQQLPKVFAERGKKQVSALTSTERGIHVVCVKYNCHDVPPGIIISTEEIEPHRHSMALQ